MINQPVIEEKKADEGNRRIENALATLVYSEYQISKTNKQGADADQEAYLDLFDCIRSEKDYDWNSDVFIPDFLTHMLVQSSLFVGQYFKSREFVEVYVASEKDKDIAAAEADKELVNRTLNQKHLYYYSKCLRAVNMKNICGHIYFRCWWEKKSKKIITGQELVQVENEPERYIPIYGQKLVYDRFNFGLLDPRDVFTSNEYTYSLQEKKWIIIRFDSTIEELEDNKELMGYTNLDTLKLAHLGSFQTETKGSESSSYYTKEKKPESPSTPIKNWMILERHGKYWADVITRNQLGEPLEIRPGIDEQGKPLDIAELFDVVITYAVHGDKKYLIRFQLAPYMDAEGNRYKPIIRGLCYIHPTMDTGFGDGKGMRELQIAINDNINMSNDRVKFAMSPVLKGRRNAIEDNESIYFAPEHIIMLDDPERDLKEIQISSDISGALAQTQYFTNKEEAVSATFPTTTGALPLFASTTATAVAGAESRGDTRNNYRYLTQENTLFSELYWMITQMTYQFANQETAEKLMGDKAYDFNPTLDYTYKPVSESIETEVSRRAKIQNWQQVLQIVSNLQHPDAVKMVNFVFAKIAALMGDEYVNFADKLLNPKEPIGKSQGQEMPVMTGMPMSNQNNVPQSALETQARSAMEGMNNAR